MRFVAYLFCLVAIIAASVQASRVRDLLSDFLANQPTEIQSALLSEFSQFSTNTQTASSILSSVSSVLNSALESVQSGLSSEVSSISASMTTKSTSNAAAASGSSYSTMAAFGALALSFLFFQAL